MSAFNVPDTLKPISPYLKIAAGFKERDPVLYFWILNYAVEQAMTITNAPEAKTFLLSLLDELESTKKAHAGNDSFIQGTVAQCHVEAKALRLFQHADEQDRNANFNKNMLQSFYTAAHLFDVLTLFGPEALDEKMQSARKYAKWKATYINTCLKNGETPKPGPPSEQNNDLGDDELTRELMNLDVKPQPQPRTTSNVPSQPTIPQNPTNFSQDQPQNFGQGYQQPPSTNVGWQPQQPGYGQQPNYGQQPAYGQQFGGNSNTPSFNAPRPPRPTQYATSPHASLSTGNVDNSDLTLEDFIEARKLTKLAASALDYEDAKTAVDFLRKAIKVLEK
ncbi:Vacuolar protein sorting-associated protein VTA1-like protein [Aphelenchoides besseyi]|nr:Vacuolar protein sorting-associated protein VTA1-like protein [Aphelenchoides besseyi]KAI6209797.1 Vacuolar protein sorting-associated protein VTA1-like protein [Aphelenchoides besseyi]